MNQLPGGKCSDEVFWGEGIHAVLVLLLRARPIASDKGHVKFDQTVRYLRRNQRQSAVTSQ